EKYAVRHEVGKPAQTVYNVMERFKGYTLLELLPRTGRTHQLRVHLAHIGHPIVGDVMYGGKEITMRDLTVSPRLRRGGEPEDMTTPLIVRQALHAYRLQFVHPTLFTRMHLEAGMPGDIVGIVELLRRYRML
ncbi:MAG: pseudouridine synthase, partial [Phycisphaerales bacterium]|nr:pseudouridine synthase [Phycisphaerales bacterium]